MKSEEYYEQVATVEYVKLRYPTVLFCASAGGMRTNIRTAVKMKRMGYIKGMPDLFFYEPRRGLYGLAIEMKSKIGSPSLEQKAWKLQLEMRGYKSEICHGFIEAKKVIDDYFKS